MQYNFFCIAEPHCNPLFNEEDFLDDQDAYFGSTTIENNLLIFNETKTHDLIVEHDFFAMDGFIENLTATNEMVTNLTATNALINNLDVDSLNISGTSLIGCDVFVGCNLYVPETTSATQGVIFKYSGTTAAPTVTPFLHNAGIDCLFAGLNSGNFAGGDSNIGVGPSTLTNVDITSFNNTSVGWYALNACTTGTDNTAIGNAALVSNTIGINNTGLGAGALFNLTTGNTNTAIGTDAFANGVDGSSNICLGYAAGNNITGGSNNIIIGTGLGGSSTDNNIIRFGIPGIHTANFQGGIRNITPIATDTAVVSIDSNSQLGTGRIYNNIDIANSTTTQGNILKNGLLFEHNAGTNSTYLGRTAGNLTNTGSINTGLGTSALTNITSGSGNTAVGVSSTRNCTIGSSNTAVGVNSLILVTSGSNNIAIGVNAGSTLTSTNDNIDIGNAGVLGDAGVIRIGTAGVHTTNFQAGIFGVNNLGIAVYLNASGQLGTTPSARRFKQNITGIPTQTMNNFEQLNPVQFTYIDDTTNSLQYGFIAEEVNPSMPELIMTDSQGAIFTVRYQLTYALFHQWLKNINSTQQQQALLIAQLTLQLNAQLDLITQLRTDLTALTDRLDIDEDLITDLRTDLTAAVNLLNTQVTLVAQLITDLTATQDLLDIQIDLITGLRTDLTTAQGLISTQNTLITGLRTDLTTAQTTINSLVSRIGILESLLNILS